jgi:hypothetical protein
MQSQAFFSCAKRFADIAGALCRAVGNAIRPGFIHVAMAKLVVGRIKRVQARLIALEARFSAGLLLAPRLRPGRAGAVTSRRPGGLPRRFGWLCEMVPGEAACFAGQLRVVLAEPGMVALLAASPQAVRMLRPVCRMLAIASGDYVPGDGVLGDRAAAVALGARVLQESMTVAVVSAMVPPDLPGLEWVRFIPG